MSQEPLIPHLFRTEFRKIVAVLCKTFGIGHMEIAEDIASETFLSALETWPYKGIPSHPTAWLYRVAKNKTKNHLQRNAVFRKKIAGRFVNSLATTDEIEIDLSEKNICDSQLQMIFAICHPSIPVESQIGLALRILCGFGIEEIANAFVTNKETVHKRLARAREKLRTEGVAIIPVNNGTLSATTIDTRLDPVLRTLYLLFNEGYYSESHDSVLREDLCLEAMRLVYLLIENESTRLPRVNALLALMCFHSSRFAARKNSRGEMILYQDQDETRWDLELITKGVYYFNQAARGVTLSNYHLEAGIAYWHTHKADTKEKWENILELYNELLAREYSPVAALNRTFALSKVRGNREAIEAAEKLNLAGNPYYYTLLGELYKESNPVKARENFQKALGQAKNAADKNILLHKLSGLQGH